MWSYPRALRRQESGLLSPSHPITLGEKAELALYETWLLILDHPFIKALENKTSSESQELRGLLTKWVTEGMEAWRKGVLLALAVRPGDTLRDTLLVF